MLVLAIVLGVIFILIFDNLSKIYRLPPGPWGLPVIGYLPWLTKSPQRLFMELGKKHGGLFSIKLGSETVVVFNDWPTIRATLVDQPKLFSGRPWSLTLETGGRRKDVSFSDGPVWKKQRNLTVHCLRSVGLGKTNMENHVDELVTNFIEKLNKLNNQIVKMESLFFEPLLKANWKLVSDRHIGNTAAELDKFEAIMRHLMDGFSANNPVNVLPWLRFLPPNGFGFWKFSHYSDQLYKHLKQTVDHHLAEWVEGSEDCFIDYYIKEIYRKRDEMRDIPPYNVDHLLGSIWDLFLAGVDTVNQTLLWGSLYLAYYPDIQQKVQNELDTIVGRQRRPSVNDFSRLPYLDAFVKEVHRKASIVVFSLPHCPISTTHMSGFTIPKGTPCIQNIFAVHHDPDLWEEPELFRPERFLDENNQVTSPPYLMPFSIGPRLCIGQSLAEMQLRLIFGSLMQRFSFILPPDQQKPSLEPENEFLLQVKPYSLLIKLRNDC